MDAPEYNVSWRGCGCQKTARDTQYPYIKTVLCMYRLADHRQPFIMSLALIPETSYLALLGNSGALYSRFQGPR
jgi:hypothetical protein